MSLSAQDRELLPRSGVLTDASDELIDALSAIANDIKLQKGEVLFQQGDIGKSMYVVQSGTLEVSVLSAEGRKLALDLMSPGNVFGEIALFDEGERTATVTAREDCVLRSIQRGDLNDLQMSNPIIAIEMTAVAGRRMRWMSQQLHEQAFLPLAERLARKILHLTSEDTAGEGDKLKMSQNDLSEYVGASREAVSKTLTVWRQDGIVEIGRGNIQVLDREALRIEAGFEYF